MFTEINDEIKDYDKIKLIFSKKAEQRLLSYQNFLANNKLKIKDKLKILRAFLNYEKLQLKSLITFYSKNKAKIISNIMNNKKKFSEKKLPKN